MHSHIMQSANAPPSDSAAATSAAAAEAARAFNQEVWSLLGVAVLVVILRTIGRWRAVGLRNFQADDYLVWIALIFYAIESALAYCVGAVARGLANNGMTDEEREALSPDDPEYIARVRGSIIQLCGWTCYSIVLWALKGALLVLYLRLTEGLSRSYIIRIWVGFAFVGLSWLVVTINLLASCRPFHHMWQINPNPGNVCQPAVALQIIWVYYAFNVTTDLYLLSIPLPLLWSTGLKPLKKAGLVFLFSGGVFVVICATLRCVYIVTDPVNGAQQAGSWAVRETFVAVVTTNLPLVVPLVKKWTAPLFSPIFSTARSSSRKHDENTPKASRTFGASKPSWRGRGPPTANPITTNISFGESEERIVGGNGTGTGGGTGAGCEAGLPLQDVQSWESNATSTTTSGGKQQIHKSVEVAIVRHERSMDQKRSSSPSEHPWVQTNHSATVEGGRRKSK